MGETVMQSVADTKDPNWGLPVSASSDPKDPNWGLPQQLKEQPSSNGALELQAVAKSAPAITRVAEEVATSPLVPKVVAKAGQLAGGAQAALRGSPFGIAGDAWAGGRAGWFTGKLAQNVAAPVANALETLAPYAQAISTVSGAQGVLDLAQMADKTRTDIGSLGFALDGERSKADKDAHPALINEVANKIVELATALKNNGVPAAEATAIKLLSAGKAATFGRLMTVYMRSGEMMKALASK